jgi:hypothetical protein
MAHGVLPHTTQDVKTYRVKKITEEFIVNGNGDHPFWTSAPGLSDFMYPWEECRASCTTFKALHARNWLYCLFTVRAEDIKVYRKANNKPEILKSDRVEIFFKQDDKLSPYYCIEVDPMARVYDYEATYHRKFNTNWSWPSNYLIARASHNAEGYVVELAIHKDSLVNLGIMKGNKIAAGLYRAECVAIHGNDAEMRWISWVKPDSKTPDFHIPSSFGVLDLEN